MKVLVNQHKELKWKLKDGSLKPINELTQDEIKTAKKLSLARVNEFYEKYEFFSSLLEQIDLEIEQRISVAQAQLETLKLLEQE
jgi:hypothetical protein